MNDDLTIVLTRDEWIALLVAAQYGANAIYREIGPFVFHSAEQVVARLLVDLEIANVSAAAFILEEKKAHS